MGTVGKKGKAKRSLRQGASPKLRHVKSVDVHASANKPRDLGNVGSAKQTHHLGK